KGIGKLSIRIFGTFEAAVLITDIDLVRHLITHHFHIYSKIIVLESGKFFVCNLKRVGGWFLINRLVMHNSLGRFRKNLAFYGKQQQKDNNWDYQPTGKAGGFLDWHCLYEGIGLERLNFRIYGCREKIVALVIASVHLFLQLKKIEKFVVNLIEMLTNDGSNLILRQLLAQAKQLEQGFYDIKNKIGRKQGNKTIEKNRSDGCIGV
ncbi:MAG: hypothetical protein II453_17640, partial [Alphaproteobacteria bacterium]|nr:hypothetical protein [Alphaproteobacteria bacterium]